MTQKQPNDPSGSITYHKLLLEMTPQESYRHVNQLKYRLQQKQQRERAYLNRRAQRGTRTPTDEVYEADQVLETELLALLDDLLQAAREQGYTP